MNLLSWVLAGHMAMAAPVVTSPGGAVNPEVTQDNLDQTICAKGWAKQARPPSAWAASVKRRLMREQHPGDDPHQYELDHKVPIEIGGCPNCETNVWLEPWRDPNHHHCEFDTLADAACKDRLENYVHRQICSGKMTLAQGQALFLGDWTKAYQTYIQDSHGRRTRLSRIN